MFSLCLFLFVNQQDYAKPGQPISQNFCEKVAHRPPKNPLDFGGSLDHVAELKLS